MSARWRDRSLTIAVAAGCYVLAFLQRPGWASSDTKINLHVEPMRFLSDVASVWTSTGALGHVQGGQYGGYLFPMGPFFAAGNALGLSPWVIHRLWLGTLLFLGAWGVIKLLDALLSRDRGIAHFAAAALFVLNPYVVTFANRTSITLLGYALLPWLLLTVHRGVRDARGWWWPVALALLVTSSSGGVNAAVTALILIGPLLLLFYEPFVVGVPWRNVYSFAWRSIVVGVLASLWWIAPVLVQARYGVDFLQFTEQPGTIWGTTSAPEALRQLGYWVSYIGVGYGGELKPYFNDARVLLFNPLVVVATLLVPSLAILGFIWTRRWRYGPFFLLLTLLGVIVVTAGFPDGKPLRLAMNFIYNHVAAVQFLRTTYKAAPLISLGIAVLGGVALSELVKRLRAPSHASRLGRLAPGVAVLVAVGLVALSAWPLVRGKAVDTQMTWKKIPAAWTDVGKDLDRDLPRNERALVLPGQLFAFYKWGGTVDPILPVVTKRPVAVRSIVPFSDLRSIDLLWAVDSLVQQGRLLPGQLRPLLNLLAVGSVIVATDDDRERSGQIQPAEAARILAGELPKLTERYGSATQFQAAAGTLGKSRALPQISRYSVPGSRGIVRVEPQANPVVVDGSASGLVALAAFGELPRDRAILYAADLKEKQLHEIATRGGEVVVSDSNRRRAFIASRLRQSVGSTQDAQAVFSEDAALLNPFPTVGSDGQTVARYDGVQYIRAPFSPGFTQFPEHRPFAALDGNAYTSWLADVSLEVPRRYIEIGFKAPRDVPYIDLLPHSDARGIVDEVEIDGKNYKLTPGWNRLKVGAENVRKLKVAIAHVEWPKGRIGGGGGIAEIKIPGLKVSEQLRPPVIAEQALARRDLDRVTLAYLFERTTGDDPFRRTATVGPSQAGKVRDRIDPERQLSRMFESPAARQYEASAWTTVDISTPDHELDRVVGYDGPYRFDSSSRFENAAGSRASSAFTGKRSDAWIGGWTQRSHAWIEVRAPKSNTVSSLKLVPPKEVVRHPTVVRIRYDGGVTGHLRVARGGVVKLPRTVDSKRIRIEILKAAFAPSASGKDRQRRAVGISEVEIPGLSSVTVPRHGTLKRNCAAASIKVGGQELGFTVDGTIEQLDRGMPLRARGCESLRVAAGSQRLAGLQKPFVIDQLQLRSTAPTPVAVVATTSGKVIRSGSQENGKYSDVKVAVTRPSWLVLGESYNKGWEAVCDDHSLGESQPIDGYANGWQVTGGCQKVSFEFAPNRSVRLAYIVGGGICLLLLIFLILRRRRTASERFLENREISVDRGIERLSLSRAAAVGVVVGLALAFVLALRAGIVAAPLLTLILWRGVTTERLFYAAGGLLLLVSPVASLIFLAGDHDPGGYNYGYAGYQEIQHWVVAGALFLVTIALVRTIRSARKDRY